MKFQNNTCCGVWSSLSRFSLRKSTVFTLSLFILQGAEPCLSQNIVSDSPLFSNYEIQVCPSGQGTLESVVAGLAGADWKQGGESGSLCAWTDSPISNPPKSFPTNSAGIPYCIFVCNALGQWDIVIPYGNTCDSSFLPFLPVPCPTPVVISTPTVTPYPVPTGIPIPKTDPGSRPSPLPGCPQ